MRRALPPPGSACKSRRERVSRIKVIDPAHLTEARITGHTMVRIVRTGLFSATHAGLSAAHYLEMPCCHSASLSYARAPRSRRGRRGVTLRYARPRTSSRTLRSVETSFRAASAGFRHGFESIRRYRVSNGDECISCKISNCFNSRNARWSLVSRFIPEFNLE